MAEGNGDDAGCFVAAGDAAGLTAAGRGEAAADGGSVRIEPAFLSEYTNIREMVHVSL